LIASVTPSLLKTPQNPAGIPLEVFDGFRKAVITNRAQFMKDLTMVYFGADRPKANIPEALLNSAWNQEMLTGFPAGYFQIKAFSETDMTGDLKKIDVPTLILHGRCGPDRADRECLSLIQAHPERNSQAVSRCAPCPDLHL
jgi:non-heme chloroperoxidase